MVRVNESRPWWLWPNLLALDAPAVAVTWQMFLASRAGVALPLTVSVVLGLVVWGVYLADRGLDARNGADALDRHRIAGHNPIVWATAAVAVLLCAAVLALVALPRTHLSIGFLVAAATTAYFATIHLLRAKWVLDRGGKEAAVGAVFAAGVAVPLIAGAVPLADWFPGVVAFAALCWLNCALISVWEEGVVSGPPLWVPGVAGICCLIAAHGAEPAVAAAVVASASALVAMHLARARVSVRAKRVLADVVLLTPLVVPVWL